MSNILRWITVLPGSLVSAVLSAFPIHLILYQTLTGSGIITPYPELPERLLGPLVAGLAFVWAGSKIAPSRKIETAVVLFGAILFLLGAGFALGLSGTPIGSPQLTLGVGGLAPVGALVGAFVGLYVVHREDSGKSDNVGSKVPES